MVELKVIDDFFLGIAPHFFIVMLILIENPLKVRDSLSEFDFLPYLSIVHDGPHQILIIIAVDYGKSKLLGFGNFIDLQLIVDKVLRNKFTLPFTLR